jgi:hypothetical protein
MSQNSDQGGADPEERAFTGSPDMPPQQPDQPAEANQELQRKDEEAEPGKEPAANPHGDYPNLPGYGG